MGVNVVAKGWEKEMRGQKETIKADTYAARTK